MSKRNAGKTEDRLPGRRSGMVTVTQSCHGHSNAKCKKITHHKRRDLRRRALGQAFCSVQKHQERETTAPREKSLARAIPPCTAAPPAFQTSHISIWLEGETQTSDIITRSVLHPDRRYCPKHPAGPAFTWQWAIGIRHGEKQRLTTEFHLCLAIAAAPGLLAALAGAFRRWKYKSLKNVMEKMDPASHSTREFSWGCRKNII